MSAIKRLFYAVDDETADELLVVNFSSAMRTKLKKKREKGYGGWQTSICTDDELKEKLKKHIEKGDMVDVANFAAMIWMRKRFFDSDLEGGFGSSGVK